MNKRTQATNTVSTLKANSLKPDMVALPGSSFLMGSLEGEDNEKPVHQVILSAFSMGKYPVTVGEFRRFVQATGYKTEAETGDGAHIWSGTWGKRKDANWQHPYFAQTEQHPVVCVSWNDARAYCAWLSEQTQTLYRLPTEAEWEYACRAGRVSTWCFGDSETQLKQYAWYEDNAGHTTHPVGEKKPNAWHLYDVLGNVWEWVDDAVKEYSAAAQTNPRVAQEQSAYRVLRGGSWNDSAHYCRSAMRNRGLPSIRFNVVGFRLAR